MAPAGGIRAPPGTCSSLMCFHSKWKKVEWLLPKHVLQLNILQKFLDRKKLIPFPIPDSHYSMHFYYAPNFEKVGGAYIAFGLWFRLFIRHTFLSLLYLFNHAC